MDFVREGGERFIRSKTVITRLAVAVFDALHEASLANFNVLIEIGSGDGEKFDPFEQRD